MNHRIAGQTFHRGTVAIAFAVALTFLLAFACGGGENRADANESGTAGTNRAGSTPETKTRDEGATFTAAGLAYEPPADWVSEKPSSSMRLAQYRIPPQDGSDAAGLVTVFHFGTGGGGALDANLRRWANQFQQDDGSDPLSRADIENFETSGLRVTTIELPGRYVTSSTMGGGVPMDEPGWRLLGAVIEGDGGPWFFKGVGPDRVMLDHREGFLSLLRGARIEG